MSQKVEIPEEVYNLLANAVREAIFQRGRAESPMLVTGFARFEQKYAPKVSEEVKEADEQNEKPTGNV